MNTAVILHTPVILSGAKDPLPACATASSARSFYHCPAVPRTDHWPLTTGH